MRNRRAQPRWYVAARVSVMELVMMNEIYLDTVSFVQDEPVIMNGMNDT